MPFFPISIVIITQRFETKKYILKFFFFFFKKPILSFHNTKSVIIKYTVFPTGCNLPFAEDVHLLPPLIRAVHMDS